MIEDYCPWLHLTKASMANGVMGQGSLYINGTRRLTDQILGGPTGKKDGAAVLSMVKMHHLVAAVGMSLMMMVPLYTN